MKIEDIQNALKKAGFDPGPIDGVMGKHTRDALRAFQKDYKLTPDGIFGPRTEAVMIAGHFLEPELVEQPDEAEQRPVKSLLNNDGTTQPKATRPIHTLVIHCTATPEGREFSREQINAMHVARGFSKIGYHRIIHLDGTVDIGRLDSEIGAHVAGHNVGTLGFSYIGGLARNGRAKDTRTPQQRAKLSLLIEATAKKYSLRAVVGHRDLSPDKDHDGIVEPWEWVKECPCFDAIPEYGYLLRKARHK
jgi:N-acetylmuramoyl-L-alanine amidase